MKMNFPASPEAAKEHLRHIRAGMGLGSEGSAMTPNDTVENLENALTLISEQLYQKSTHFLLEALQNADDNTYRAKYWRCSSIIGANMRLPSDASSKDALVPIPSSTTSDGGTWAKSGDCVWKIPALDEHYSLLGGLFQGIIQIKDADLSTLVAEASCISMSDDLGSICQLFGAISVGLRLRVSAQYHDLVRDLAFKPIFPVKDTGPLGSFDSLQSGLEGNQWLIADTPRLRQTFDRRISLLAFGSHQIAGMSYFLDHLNLGRHRLSRVGRMQPIFKSGISPCTTRSLQLRRKAHLIAS
ncbi:hypothetical protein OQA88_4401 [Cercophora sp. LCS_1]